VARVVNAAGMYVVGSSPAEFAAFLQHDYDYQDKLMTELGLKAK
jgi:tripartite-type tricarboxylate transporter receptor subunit TctC